MTSATGTPRPRQGRYGTGQGRATCFDLPMGADNRPARVLLGEAPMRTRSALLVVAVVGCVGLGSLASGCAADAAQGREADYPAPVGYTAVSTDSRGLGTRSPPLQRPAAPPAPQRPAAPPAPQRPAAPRAPQPSAGLAAGSPSAPAPQPSQAGWSAGGAPPPPSTGNAPPPPPEQPPPGWTGSNGPPGPPPGWTGTASPVGEGAPADAPLGPPGEGVASGGPDDGSGYSDADPSALSDFRSTLDPYGNWVDDPTYGTVWVPSPTVVGQDFTPYVSAGHWGYGDDYVWVSDYDWGWAPFHYGRWVYGGPAGWEWVPGRTYAGAWVAWRYGVGDWGYVGWAPLGPTWGWRAGMAVGIGFVPSAPYFFVGAQDLFAPAVGGRLVTGPQVGVVASHTQPYMPAPPHGGSPLGMRFAVGGPPLSALHISPSAVVLVSAASNRGLAQAQAFSRPTTAVALGARGPQRGAARAEASFRSTRLSGNIARSGTPIYAARVPAYAPAEPSHFGGRLGAGSAGNAASAQPSGPYSGSASTYYAGPRDAAPSYGGQAAAGVPGGAYRSYSAPSVVPNSASRGGAAPAPSGGGGSHTGGGSTGGRSGGRR
jgi:hypothetical protein